MTPDRIMRAHVVQLSASCVGSGLRWRAQQDIYFVSHGVE
jgi:hypothetical protein